MTLANEVFYEDVRKQLLTEIRLCPESDHEKLASRIQSLKELEEAQAKVAESKLSKDKALAVAAYVVGLVVVAILDRHFPLTSKAFSLVAKPHVL